MALDKASGNDNGNIQKSPNMQVFINPLLMSYFLVSQWQIKKKKKKKINHMATFRVKVRNADIE